MPRVLYALVALSVGWWPLPAAADWARDELYVGRLAQLASELRQGVALLEQGLRAMDLVEAGVADIQPDLASPRQDPERLVRLLLARHQPEVTLTMKRQPTPAIKGVGTWRWQVTLEGPLPALADSVQRLWRAGLFVIPTKKEPVSLLQQSGGRTPRMRFLAHHVRLEDTPGARQLPLVEGDDVFAHRTDPLAVRIRQLRQEIQANWSKLENFGPLETRVSAIDVYLKSLKQLAVAAQNPMDEILPLAALDLVRFDRITHQGRRVLLWGATFSPSARHAALRWLRRHQRSRRSRYALQLLRVDRRPRRKLLWLGEELAQRPHAPSAYLLAAGAHPAHLGVAAGAQAVLVLGQKRSTPLEGKLRASSTERALDAAANAAGYTLVRDGAGALLIAPPELVQTAEALLLAPAAWTARGQQRRLFLVDLPLSEALPAVAQLHSRPLHGPEAVLTDQRSVSLLGSAPAAAWLRLLASPLGLHLSAAGNDGSLLLTPPGEKVPLRSIKAKAAPPAALSTSPLSAGALAEVRLTLAVMDQSSPLAVAIDAAGRPFVVKQGMRLGRNQARVLRVTSRGVVLRWTQGGIKAQVVLPL